MLFFPFREQTHNTVFEANDDLIRIVGVRGDWGDIVFFNICFLKHSRVIIKKRRQVGGHKYLIYLL